MPFDPEEHGTTGRENGEGDEFSPASVSARRWKARASPAKP